MSQDKKRFFSPHFFTPTAGFTGFYLERAPMVLELQRVNTYWSTPKEATMEDGERTIGETESSTGAVGALPFLMGGAVKLANAKRRTLPEVLKPEDIEVRAFCAAFSLNRRYDSYWVSPSDFQVMGRMLPRCKPPIFVEMTSVWQHATLDTKVRTQIERSTSSTRCATVHICLSVAYRGV